MGSMVARKTALRTDLAVEAREIYAGTGELSRLSGVRARDERVRGFAVTRVEILDEAGEAALGKPRGTYLTLALDGYVRRRSGTFEDAVQAVAGCVRPMLPREGTALVACLGNEAVTPDALGPLAMRSLCVTRHMLRELPEAFAGFRPVACVAPGVLGTTGIESLELVRGAAAHTQPAVIVAVDALASMSMTRLCATVQVTDAGICPGSGVGNARAAFSRESLGVPVIAVGVPTVVDAGTLARELTGEEPVRDDGGARMIVTPREIDVRVADMAKVIGYGLNLALHDGMTVADAALFLS